MAVRPSSGSILSLNDLFIFPGLIRNGDKKRERERLAVRLPTISRGQSVIIIVVVQLLIWGVRVERKEFFYLPLLLLLYYVSSSIHPSIPFGSLISFNLLRLSTFLHGATLGSNRCASLFRGFSLSFRTYSSGANILFFFFFF